MRIALYGLAAVAVVVIAFSTSWQPVHRTGAQGSPASWRVFLTAYLYASLEGRSKEPDGGSRTCDYPPTTGGESGDHDEMVGFARCLSTLGELSTAKVAALEGDDSFAVTNGDWLPFELAGIRGVARNGAAITVSTSRSQLERTRFVTAALAGLALLGGVLALDTRRRRRGDAWS